MAGQDEKYTNAQNMLLYPEQCAGARAMLGWTQQDLAEAAGVARRTIVLFEQRTRIPHRRILRDIREALERHVMLIDAASDGGPGVRLKLWSRPEAATVPEGSDDPDVQ